MVGSKNADTAQESETVQQHRAAERGTRFLVAPSAALTLEPESAALSQLV